MAIKKTLYIVGAGASSEANLPTGQKLKSEISHLLNIEFDDMYSQSSGDRLITEALRFYSMNYVKRGADINPYIHACRQIRNAMPQAISIDNFIDTHKGDDNIELCGKLAIVRSILEAEKNSLLYMNPSNSYNKMDFNSLSKSWYSSFMMLLTENCKQEELAERLRTISLVVFNYDRCIEHFLFHSFQNYYGVTPEVAGNYVKIINIFHPYGVVGNLPWQGGQAIEYGGKPNPQQLIQLADQIKTFTEGTDEESSEIITIRNNVTEADNIVFLGFAYHKQNIKLMSTDSFVPDPLASTTYFGTAHGISDSDCDIIKRELSEFNDKNIEGLFINNKLNCADLFKEYWRSLSLN